ncbi:MAG TPA: phage tail protein [Bacteroidia bacterium]|nr:phage tail protein [Bacteroidia bacterium]
MSTEASWPLPKLNFLVYIDGMNCTFQEISGLETETRQTPTEFKPGNIPSDPKKIGNVVLKKGLFVQDIAFSEWYSKINMNTSVPGTCIIHLLDESGNSIMTWTLYNALVTKIEITDLKTDDNEVAVESVEIAYETLTIQTG